MKNLTKKICFIIASLALLLVSIFIIKPPISATAANNVTLEISSSLTEIKSNNTSQEFTITVTIKNNSGKSMQTSQATVNFDPTYFEYVSWSGSTSANINSQLSQAPGMSDLPNGKVMFYGEDRSGADITLTQWVLGSFKLKLKAGVSLAGVASSSITLNADETELVSADGDLFEYDTIGDNLAIKFAEPSNACDITSITVAGQTPALSGNTYSVTVPYSVSTLNSSNVNISVSANAKHNFTSATLNSVGSSTNHIAIRVTAEDGKTYKDYNLNVTRTVGETVKTLSALTFKNGSNTILSKDAADLGTAGTYNVENSIAFADKGNLRVEFTKNGSFSTAEVLLDGKKQGNTITTATSGLNLGANVAAGAHRLTVKVNPEDGGAANEYVITFTVEGAQNDNTLKSLTLEIVGGDPVNFSEPFSPTTLNYSASVPKGTAKVVVKAEANGTLAQVTGAGEYTVPNSIKVTVTAQDNSKTEYTIVVAEQKDTSGVTLSEVKAWGIDSDNGKHALTITQPNASVEDYFTITIPFTLDIAKYRIDAGTPSGYEVQGVNFDIPLPNKDRQNFTHSVFFRLNGVHEKTIIFDFIFESNIKTLFELYCGDKKVDLSSGKNYFLEEVDKMTNKVLIDATPTDSNAKVTIVSVLDNNDGEVKPGAREIDLASGITPVIITVKATNGEEGMYILCVKRPVGSQTLQSLMCGEQQVTISDNSELYEVKVGKDVDRLKITAGAVEGATVEFIPGKDVQVDETVVNQNGEMTVLLNGGGNSVLVKVTAADGSVGCYALNISREIAETNNTMPYVVAIVVISLVAVLVIIALVVVIIVNRRRA